MATTTNSTTVNIANLPVAQLANNTDLLILETQNGTQTIPFQFFNVVRTDLAGNATVTGDLTGGQAHFTDLRVDSVSINPNGNIFCGSEQGMTSESSYQNTFKITNGVVTTASYVFGSPEYNRLYSLYQTISANSSQAYRKVYEYNGVATILNGRRTSNIITVGSFPKDSTNTSVGSLIYNNNVYASYFTITPFIGANGQGVPSDQVVSLSGLSYFPGTNNGDDYLQFSVCLADLNKLGDTINVGCRILYFYN
jgi:hypothetical protein